MIKNIFNFKKGFTLVELMVVISIIGILSAVVYANFSDVRKIARDDTRKTDLKNLQLAIELYKAQNGEYPDACTDTDTGWEGDVPGTFNCPSGQYIAGLVPDFISELPLDPTASSNAGNDGYIYRVRKVGGLNVEYKLMAFNTVEKVLVTSYEDEFARCPVHGTTNCPETLNTSVRETYAVYKGSAISGW